MGFLSDLMLAAGAFGAAVYCLVLARRLRALTTLDSGMGQAIALLSAQVDDLGRALERARDGASAASGRLGAQTERAEAACRRLELLIAALHDLPDEGVRNLGDPGRAQHPRTAEPAGTREAGKADEAAPPVRGARILRRHAPGPEPGSGRRAGHDTGFGARPGAGPGAGLGAGLGAGRAA